MLGFAGRQPQFLPPAAGSKALFFGNSKVDTAGGLGQWCDIICNYFGWIPVNRNQVGNGGFERDANGTLQTTAGGNAATNVGWQVSGTGGQLLRESTTVFAGAGSGELLCATVGGGTVKAGPYNPATITWGVDTAAFAGGMRCGLVAGRAYTGSGAFWTNGPANALSASLYYKIGSGGTPTILFNLGGFVPNDSAWHSQAGSGTIPATATEAWLEIAFSPTTNTTFALFDNIQIEPFCGGMTSGVATTYADYYTRGGISGALLQPNDAAAAGFAAPYTGIFSDGWNNTTMVGRVYTPAPDIVFIEYNLNDLYYTSGAGATTPTSAATWRAAMAGVLSNINANLPNAKIVVLGASNTTFPFLGGAGTCTVVGGTGYTNGTYTIAGNGSSNFTVVVAGGAIVSAVPVAPGWNYAVGTAITVTGMGAGTGGSITVATLNPSTVYAFGASTYAQSVGIQDAITASECSKYKQCLFVPIYRRMDAAYCSTLTNDGKHPSRPVGMQLVADIVAEALQEGAF